MELARGHATPDGTARFRKRAIESSGLPESHFRNFLDLSLGSIGIGTYLGRPDANTDRLVTEAILQSLRSGAVNVIDSAINYRDGRGERSIGEALHKAYTSAEIRREEIFVATKNGYANSGSDLKGLVSSGKVAQDEVASGCNCMSPAYLELELERSRQSLGLETIDLLYLHNVTDEQIPALGQRVFLDRLKDSFGFLEDARKEGHIRFYGLATWDSLRVPQRAQGHLDLEDALLVAREVGGAENGFRFVQFPFNMAMPEAATARVQRAEGAERTVLDASSLLGIGTFSSVPLLQGRLPAREALQFARSAPHHLAPLVGQKSPEHVRANLEVAQEPPMGSEEFLQILNALKD